MNTLIYIFKKYSRLLPESEKIVGSKITVNTAINFE